MPGAFRIAEGYVQVDADQTAYDAAIDRIVSDRHAVSVNIDLDAAAAFARIDELVKERTAKVRIDLDVADVSSRLDELTRERTIKVNIDLDSTPLATLSGHTYEADVHAVINQPYYDRAKAKLDKLTADRFILIRANVDTRVGAEEIRNLIRRRTVRINTDVDTRVGAQDLANLTRSRTVRINAQARTADARAQLDRLARDRDANINIRSRGIGSAAGGLGILSSRIGRLVALAVSASPAILGLAETIIQMGPAAAVAVPAILSLGSAFAAIKIGTGGIGDAFKAAFAPAVSAGGAAERATNAVADAQRGLARATRNAADSQRSAAQQVAGAERDLTRAQQQALAAQKAINDARKQAARDLQDLNNNLVDAQFAEQDAQNAVEDAATALGQAQATGDPEAISRAQLAYDEAVQALKEQQLQVQRLRADTDAANKAGVDGSDAVVQAKQNEADAVQDVRDKTEALANAQLAQTRAAQDAADAIIQAQEALAQANQSAATAAAGVNAFANAMAKLAPAAREFVQAVLAQRGAWTALKLDVQQRLFAGLGASFTTMANATLPSLRQGLDGTAGILNTMAKNALSAATNLGKTGMLKRLFDGLNGSLAPLSRIPGQFITGLTQIGIAAQPAFKRLTDAAGQGADSIAQRLSAAFKSGALTDAINDAVDLVKQLVDVGKNVGGIFHSLFQAANSSGAGFLNTLQTITGAINTAFKDPAVQSGLTALFSTLSQIAKTAGPLLVQALKTVAPVLTALGPPVQSLIRTLGSALQPIIKALGPVLLAAAGAVGALVTAGSPLLTVVGRMIAQLGPVLTPVLKIVSDLFVALAPVVAQLAQTLLPPFTKITQTLADVFVQLQPVLAAALQQLGEQGLVPIIAALGTILAQLVDQYADQFLMMFQNLLPIIPLLVPVLVQLAQTVSQLLLAVAPLIPQILTLTTQLVAELLPAILPLVPPILQLATVLLSLASDVIEAVVVPTVQKLIDFMNGLKSALQPAIEAIKWVTDHIAAAFEWLYDHLLGHSVIPDIVNGIVGWFAGLPGKAVKALGNIASRLGSVMSAATDRMIGATITGLKAVVSWFKDLPGRAKDALGDLGSYLYQSGQALLGGFISGITSKIGDLTGAVSGALSKAKGFFPNSPAKEGPFSGAGWTFHSGVATATDWAEGLTATTSTVTAAASGLLGSAHQALNRGLLTPGATLATGFGGGPTFAPAPTAAAATPGGGITLHMTLNTLTMPTPTERRAWAKAMAKDVNDALIDYNGSIRRPGVGR